MHEKELNARIERLVAQLTVEELEQKIAPVDCGKKPNHPDCQPRTVYGGPAPAYGGPMP